MNDDARALSSFSLKILEAGLLTTVQDLGRWGYQARGVPPAGPMDCVSHRWANRLIGNPPDAACLEITLIGPALRFEGPATVAVSGAEFDLFLDDQPVAMHSAVQAHAGAVLRFGRRRRGARAYLAVAGGLAVRPVLGSRATHLVGRMGGVDGRGLSPGDSLPVGRVGARRGRLPVGPPPIDLPDGGATVRVMPGPHDRRFLPEAIEVLGERFIVSPESNRMAYRLDGPALARLPDADIISDVTPTGGLQVPASGRPILLMADRATTGGYPMIATVITADLPLAGQLAPGDWIRFAVCSHADAMQALVAQEQHLTQGE